MNSSVKVVKQMSVVLVVAVLVALVGAQWGVQNLNPLEVKPQIIMADDGPKPCPWC